VRVAGLTELRCPTPAWPSPRISASESDRFLPQAKRQVWRCPCLLLIDGSMAHLRIYDIAITPSILLYIGHGIRTCCQSPKSRVLGLNVEIKAWNAFPRNSLRKCIHSVVLISNGTLSIGNVILFPSSLSWLPSSTSHAFLPSQLLLSLDSYRMKKPSQGDA
jgi:hypothetical protein